MPALIEYYSKYIVDGLKSVPICAVVHEAAPANHTDKLPAYCERHGTIPSALTSHVPRHHQCSVLDLILLKHDIHTSPSSSFQPVEGKNPRPSSHSPVTGRRKRYAWQNIHVAEHANYSFKTLNNKPPPDPPPPPPPAGRGLSTEWCTPEGRG